MVLSENFSHRSMADLTGGKNVEKGGLDGIGSDPLKDDIRNNGHS